MSRLQAELQRLYGGADTRERALVLALARPADWDALGRVWRGVQADLGLPAPAIAVSGDDALQLWFALRQPVDAALAADFLARLAARYLGDVAPQRLRLLAGGPPPVPAPQPGGEQWSAFVAPDLAPVFADTPWLDLPPGADGQAELLARLAPIAPEALDAALRQLAPAASSAAAAPAVPAASDGPTAAPADVDPRRFLQQVLNDASAPLALRVEAARALLGARDG